MNTDYLMQYISYHLHTIVRKYSSDKMQISSFCARMNFQDFLADRPELEAFLLEIPSNELPLLSSINNDLIYASLVTPDGIFLIGPVCFTEPIHIKHQIYDIPIEDLWRQSIYSCDFPTLVEYILLMHNLCRTNILDKYNLIRTNCVNSLIDITIQKHFSLLLFENQEAGNKHNPYDQEVREFTSIENGNLDQLEKSWAEDYTGTIGTLAKDKLRSYKNMCIVVITLASRAAIRGGLNPEISFSLSDIYIMKIEEINDIATLSNLIKDAEYKYTTMVNEIKKNQSPVYRNGRNPRINKCKDYIFLHLHEKICVQVIAQELDMNPKYLSDLFKQYEGISITNFILNEKINLVKNLLVYSKYSYLEIASYLGFSSQSHLGTQFKKETGLTLKQYRTIYGVKEFI